ncbi:ParA family protein [Elioraea sp. Yellowstone]|uniref:ParA family protein n=1 Tax=Elioraea sp. Yellowstone TaxID=2592070 RepID=UPI00114E2BB6|nr:ParA family protein [Elioraea sp. Yellowstone]TQF79057.1 ParA family protein [Elioraea sp. Yellowstone]
MSVSDIHGGLHALRILEQQGRHGKTSLCFQAICGFAEKHQNQRILVVDACPQANLSELLLGGLTGMGSQHLLQQHGAVPRRSLGGYFQQRLSSPYNVPTFQPQDFIATPSTLNSAIPNNIHLVCGDPLLELQSNAINTLSNTQIPGTNTWISIVDWISDFLNSLGSTYDTIFIDCNPSFSIYTQIALATAERLVLPVMADDSSRRAVQNALSLLYGLSLPSPIYATYAFNTKLTQAGRALPQVHLIAKNRITQYMGPASAYAAVLTAIDNDINALLATHPNLFTFNNMANGTAQIRDFQTTGVVAFAKGLPFSRLKSGKQSINNRRVQVKEDYRRAVVKSIDSLVAKL